MAKASSLVVVTLTPAAGRRPLVAPDGEEAPTGVAAAEVGDGDGAQRQHDDDEHRERARVGAGPSRTRRRRRGRRCAVRGPWPPDPGRQAGQLGVLEVELLDHHHRGQRHDGQLDAPDAQRGQADEHADDHGHGHAGRHGDQQREPGSVQRAALAVAHQPDRDERGRAGQGQLGQADLAHVADEHDVAERQDAEDQARRQAELPRARQLRDQRDAADADPGREQEHDRRPDQRVLPDPLRLRASAAGGPRSPSRGPGSSCPGRTARRRSRSAAPPSRRRCGPRPGTRTRWPSSARCSAASRARGRRRWRSGSTSGRRAVRRRGPGR